jgi:hypothetical protein
MLPCHHSQCGALLTDDVRWRRVFRTSPSGARRRSNGSGGAGSGLTASA